MLLWKVIIRLKLKLLNAYCSTFYVFELWDLQNSNISNICCLEESSKKGVKICHLIHTVMSNVLPVFDAVCRCVLCYLLFLRVLIVTVMLLNFCQMCDSVWLNGVLLQFIFNAF